jgi:hypothetical protein
VNPGAVFFVVFIAVFFCAWVVLAFAMRGTFP